MSKKKAKNDESPFKGMYYNCNCGKRAKVSDKQCHFCNTERPEYDTVYKYMKKNQERFWIPTEKEVALDPSNYKFDKDIYIGIYEAVNYFKTKANDFKTNRRSPELILDKKKKENRKKTVKDVYKDFIEDREENKKIDMSNQRFLFIAFEKKFSDHYVSTITTSEIKKFLTTQINNRNDLNIKRRGKSLSAETKDKYVGYISTFFEYCIDNEITDKNPTKPIEYKTSKDNNKTSDQKFMPLFMYPDHFKEFWEEHCLPKCSRFALKILLAALTGGRSGEIDKLTPRQFDLETGYVELQSKGQDPDYVRMPQSLINYAKYHIRINNLGINDRIMKNDGTKRGGPRHYFKEAREEFALKYPEYKKLNYHSFRHTCATWLYAKTKADYLVGSQLRQSTIQTTKRYIHIKEGHIERIMRDGDPFEVIQWSETETE
jgi:integrase